MFRLSSNNAHSVGICCDHGDNSPDLKVRRSLAVALRAASLAGIFLSGCRSEPEAASFSSVDRTTPGYVRTFSDADRDQVRREFQELTSNHVAVSPPAPAKGPVPARWSDVPLAAAYACDDAEAAIVATNQYDWGYEFRLRTIEDWPGTLTIRRTHDARIYEATAFIGLKADEGGEAIIDHSSRAEALLKALDRQMLEFGRKPSLSRD